MSASELATAFVAAVDGKDAEALGALFADDAIFVNIMGMPMLGRDGIVAGHRWAFDGPLRNSTVGLIEVVEDTTDDHVAIAHARLHRGCLDQRPGESLPEGDTMLVLTARRHGDRWLIQAAANVEVTAPSGR